MIVMISFHFFVFGEKFEIAVRTWGMRSDSGEGPTAKGDLSHSFGIWFGVYTDVFLEHLTGRSIFFMSGYLSAMKTVPFSPGSPPRCRPCPRNFRVPVLHFCNEKKQTIEINKCFKKYRIVY